MPMLRVVVPRDSWHKNNSIGSNSIRLNILFFSPTVLKVLKVLCVLFLKQVNFGDSRALISPRLLSSQLCYPDNMVQEYFLFIFFTFSDQTVNCNPGRPSTLLFSPFLFIQWSLNKISLTDIHRWTNWPIDSRSRLCKLGAKKKAWE